MKLTAFVGVCEPEAAIAPVTIDQLVRICRGRGVDLSLAIRDDASPSRLGERLVAQFQPALSHPIDLVRLEQSSGYYGAIDRTLDMFRHLAESGQGGDYVLRLDPDVHFCREDVGRLFDTRLLPVRGLVGPLLQMRPRDHVQVYLDLLPVGFRRREFDGRREHAWQLRRRAVWFRRVALGAIRNGFRGQLVPGPFQLLAWPTLREIHARGYLRQPRRAWGLVFGEDILTNLLVRAVGHPVVDVRELVPDWRCELFLDESATAESLRMSANYFVHPLKDRAWAHAIRREVGPWHEP